MLTKTELGRAIGKAIELKIEKGLVKSKAEIARHFEIKPPSLVDWVKRGSISKEKWVQMITYFSDVVPMSHWYPEGTDPKDFESDEAILKRLEEARARQQYIVKLTNVEPATIKGSVPLVSWVQAGDFSEAIDLYQPGHAEEWIDTTVAIKQHTFALRVFNDSMEPDFPPGTILIVEPEMDALPGDYVIAKNGDNEATFKQLIRDGSDLYLKPLNLRYPMKKVDDKVRIIGVVRSAERKFR